MLLSDDKLIDLHIHTIYSDGEISPLEVVDLVRKKNIGTFSITDHDTILGAKKLENFIDNDLVFIPGIELSAKVDRGRMHILGYGIDLSNKCLCDKMMELKDNSINSVCNLIAQVKKDYNIVFDENDIINIVNSIGNVGRPDVAKLLVKYGFAKTVQEAFDKYLIEAYKKSKSLSNGLSPEECIDLILKAKGIPILAHPCSLKRSQIELLSLIKELISYGLMGLEVFHSDHTMEESNFYMSIIDDNNMVYSGGSDFHGPFIKPDIELGTGKNNNVKIKELSILSRLK